MHILHIVFISAYVAYFCLKPHVYRKGAGSSAKKQNRASPASGATPSNQRKSSLLADTSDIEVVDAEEFSAQERTDRKGRALTNSGRPSIKKNAVNAKYGTNYRNASVIRPIMGKNVTLGRACALVAVALMGPNIPLEEAGHEERLRIFKSAAYYALTDEELEEILDTEDAALRLFLKGLCTAQCRLIKYVVPVAARDEFENVVFRPASKNAVIQKHLGLEMAQSIFDQ